MGSDAQADVGWTPIQEVFRLHQQDRDGSAAKGGALADQSEDRPKQFFEHIQDGAGSVLQNTREDLDLANASDTNLLVAIGRWRQDALAELYRRHGGAVYALARRVTGDISLAEEITQEVFLRLWNAPERHDPDRGSLRTYLLVQAHGRSVDVLRSDRSRRLREERDALRTVASGYDVDHAVWDMAVADQVRQAMASLPEDERRAIELAYFGGYTYKEVAGQLKQPEGTVKSRIRTGLRRMRSSLVDSGVREP
ncbi:MAG: sigma-70 family RNA polymerase sigma factor [Actinobacteria bacterium]|nr:sigma-70 family RNA polymerase sigma factor [Actinomycetota bacterium]